jgi:hypothetical protein
MRRWFTYMEPKERAGEPVTCFLKRKLAAWDKLKPPIELSTCTLHCSVRQRGPRPLLLFASSALSTQPYTSFGILPPSWSMLAGLRFRLWFME